MTYDGSLRFDTKIDTNGFTKGTNTIKSQANGLKSTLAGLGRAMVAAFSVVAILNFGKAAIDVASDLNEVQNVVDTAFGDMSYKIEDFAKTSIQNFGLSKLAAKQMASTYMAMSTGMGQMSDVASDMAVNITGRLGDIMSFYNKTQSEADTIGRAVYSGETEPLKALGVVMTQTNLKAFAMANGFSKSYDAMSAGEQLYVRQLFFLEQTNLAAGDFVKTSGSWANQTRVLSEQWKNFMAILGQGLIRVLTPVVQFLNVALTQLTEFATQVGSVLSSVFNLGSATGTTAKNTAAIASGSEDAASGLSDMGNAAKKASKDANGTAGFDKLNNMTESIADSSSDAAGALSSIGSSGGAYTVSVEADTSKLDSGLSKTSEHIKASLNAFNAWVSTNFAPIFNKIWTDLQPGITTFKTTLSGMFSDIQTLVQPLIGYLTGPFTEYLSQFFTTAGEVVVGLFDTFNLVFSDIWNLAIFPYLQTMITTGLPMLAEFSTQMLILFGLVFGDLNKGFQELWTVVIAPVIGFISKAWIDLMNMFASAWNKWGAPIMAGIQTAWTNTANIFKAYWDKYLKPVWIAFMSAVTKLWDEHLKPLLANFLDFVGELVNGALTIYNKFIAPLLTWFIEKFGPPISKVISGLITFIGNFLGGILDAVSGIITALKGIVQFIVGVFTGDWKKAWTGIQNIFKGVFDALVNIVRTPVNLIIDIINGMVSGIVSGINTVLKAVNKISFDMPDWLGGGHVGFDFKMITAPKIPKLATGTVVPANYGEFLAVLGDNKREAEVVSPISSMKQAFKEAMQEMGSSGSGELTVNVYLSGKQIHTEVVKQDKNYRSQNGKSAFAY